MILAGEKKTTSKLLDQAKQHEKLAQPAQSSPENEPNNRIHTRPCDGWHNPRNSAIELLTGGHGPSVNRIQYVRDMGIHGKSRCSLSKKPMCNLEEGHMFGSYWHG